MSPGAFTRAGALVLVVAVMGATTSHAQGLVAQQRLSAALANELVGETVAICAKKGYKVAVAVVDLDGVRQAFLRGDGSPIHSSDNAFYKAYTAASMTLGRNEGSTREVAERMAKNPPSTVPPTQLPNITYAVGGVAIKANGVIIAGIGVSGAPGGQFDEECAREALAKIEARMK